MSLFIAGSIFDENMTYLNIFGFVMHLLTVFLDLSWQNPKVIFF